MKLTLWILLIMAITWQAEVEITHHRKGLEGKTHIGNYNISIDKSGNEDNMDMIHRGYDSVKSKARELDASLVYINGRRWRYMGRKLVVITEMYKD